MLRHLVRLVWNRRRANALLVLEIFFSFLATFVVATFGLYCFINYHGPLGFDYRDVWQVEVTSLRRHFDHPPDAGLYDRLATLEREMRALPPVVAVAGADKLPYSGFEDRSTIKFRFARGPVSFDFAGVTRDFDRALGLHLVAGRWFARGDEALAWQPVVIDRQLARAAFGDADPVGRLFHEAATDGSAPERRVVGVVSGYRERGELAAAKPFAFFLEGPETPWHQPLAVWALRLRSGTSAAFEDDLMHRLRAVAPDWSFRVEPLAEARESSFRVGLAVLAAGGLLAAFLLAMIGLGMVGVLWQALLQRTREMGLRRAAGAARLTVQRQILAEQLLLAGFAMAAGMLIVVQFPLFDPAGFMSFSLVAGGAALAAAAILLLVVLSTFQPSLMASRVQPAEALRYE